MMNAEQCVPVKALAVPEEGEQLVAPEVGDRVSYTIEGKVTRVEGEQAYVQPETVNGEAIADAKPEPTAEQQEAGAYAQLEEEAGKLGQI